MRTAMRLFIVLLILAGALSAFQGARNALFNPKGSIDLGAPLKASQLLVSVDPYGVYLAGTREAAITLPFDRANPFISQPNQAPSVLMLFWPLAWMPWFAAKLAWLLSNLAFTAGILWLLRQRYLSGRSPWLLAGLAGLLMTSVTWRNIIGNGQHLLASLFFFLLALRLADRGRPWLAGVALALSFFKYTVILFLLPYLIWRRQWRPIGLALAIHAAMTCGVALWLGTDPIRLVAGAAKVGSALSGQGYVDLFALSGAAGLPSWIASIAAAVLTGLTLFLAVSRKGAMDGDLFLAALCLVALLVVYHRAYDFVLLIVPLCVAIRRWPADRLMLPTVAALVLPVWLVNNARTHVDMLDGKGVYYGAVAACCYLCLATLMWKCFQTTDKPDILLDIRNDEA